MMETLRVIILALFVIEGAKFYKSIKNFIKKHHKPKEIQIYYKKEDEGEEPYYSYEDEFEEMMSLKSDVSFNRKSEV